MKSNIELEKQKSINGELYSEMADTQNQLSQRTHERDQLARKLAELKTMVSIGNRRIKKLLADEDAEAIDPRDTLQKYVMTQRIGVGVGIMLVAVFFWMMMAKVNNPQSAAVPDASASTTEVVQSLPELPPPSLDEKLVNLSGYLTSDKISSPIPAEVFIQTEQTMNCDADLLVAITGADSSYGKNLTTSYNPGNVGNTSSGARRGFDSWQEGVDAICRALNNQYLGSLNMIGELSNGGRSALGLPACGAAKCYAHSTSSWNSNVLHIMSELKGQQIDESYVFRRGL